MARRRTRYLAGFALLCILGAAALWFVQTPDYVILPGVTENLNRIVQVKGAKRVQGRMLMVAVDIEPANLYYYLVGRFTPFGELVPQTLLLGNGSESQYEQLNIQAMSQSHLYAKVAALRLLKYPASETGQGAYVYGVLQHVPASGRLKVGDVVVAVNGQPVHLDTDMENILGKVRPGASVNLTVLRAGKYLQMRLSTVPNPTLKNHAMVGISIITDKPDFKIPVPIHISTGDISGPSAGMMFSLSIIDQLRPSLDLTHGMTVAGTGTIDAQGDVGAIGGVKEKVITVYRAGAKVFLVPNGDYADAVHEAKALGITQKMRIIPVGTLQQAVQALERLKG